MKLFRVIAALSLLVPALLFTGCATSNITPAQVVADGCSLSHALVGPSIDLSLQYAVSNPTNRATLEAQINVVASNVLSLTTSGNYSPSAIAAAFKVKDPYLNALLAVIPAFYGPLYNQLSSVGAVTDAVAIVDCVAYDAQAATTPASMAASKARRTGQPLPALAPPAKK